MKINWIIAAWSALLVSGCVKEIESPKASYEIEFNALKAGSGVTVFDTIQYRDTSGTIQTLLNDSSDFRVQFSIPDTFDVFFRVSGTVTQSPIEPQAFVSYSVYRTLEGVKTKRCEEIYSRLQNVNGTYSINTRIQRKFDKSACQ